MSLIHWQDNWTLGIDLMDAEHRALVDGINQLAERFAAPVGGAAASPAGLGGAALDVVGVSEAAARQHADLIAALEVLADHAREHFKHEETLMRSLDYPELASHRSEHALLLAEFVEMVRDLERQDVTWLDADTMEALYHWLVGHMVGADRDYADHYFAVLAAENQSQEVCLLGP
jgi:hemerythrin